MKICFVSIEIFAWGKYGGFGRATRMIGRELVKRGFQVFAVVPQRGGQKPIEDLDGITVYSFSPLNPLKAIALFKKCDADIYHSEEPSLSTYLAKKAMPDRMHIATSRDPKSYHDFFTEIRSPSVHFIRSFLSFLYENNFLVKKTVQKLDGVYYCAKYLQLKTQKVYSLEGTNGFLPTPVMVPKHNLQKFERPTVCFVARWDRRKRPELFFKLAEKFPEVDFMAPGKSHNYKQDVTLREKYKHLTNLKMPGFLNQFSGNQLWEIFEKSWILINTATREGLPTSFLEAMAHRCAILSQANPEDITERFGYHVKDGDFEKGLKELLHQNQWAAKGEAGYRYVSENYELKSVIDRHVELYKKLI